MQPAEGKGKEMISKEVFAQFVKAAIDKELRVAVISHNDLDGGACIMLAKSVFPCVTQQYNTSYNGVNKLTWRVLLDKEKPVDAVIVTDISINDMKLISFIEREQNRAIFLFDHHETAKELNKYEWATVCEDQKSGTALFWEYLEYALYRIHGDSEKYSSFCAAVAGFVKHVDAYDTWKWVRENDTEAVDLSILYDRVGQEAFEKLASGKEIDKWGIYADSVNLDIVANARNKMKWIIFPSAERNTEYVYMELPKVGGGVVNEKVGICVTNGEWLSLTAEHLSKICETNFICTGNFVSFRTKNAEVDLAAYAEKFGGGGHSQASGANMNTDLLREVMAGWYERKHNIEFVPF
jgi:oligoribonuclease NrnB/cAMP/cGMP phosphodiesterase (DHH superfamily)